MTETALIAFTTFFATIDPPGVAVIFAGMTTDSSPLERRATAMKGSLVGACILIAFALVGKSMLDYLGITIPALRTAGGILLFLIAIDMVFARSSGGRQTTDDERHEAQTKQDISVFPIATPLIAGPGAMGAAILLMTEAAGDLTKASVVIAALCLNIVIVYILLRAAGKIKSFLGVTGHNVITRVIGILLAALAVQFVFDGIAKSGLIQA